MDITPILVGICLFMILVLIAVRVGVRKQKEEDSLTSPTIHTSGIYSIVRKSPRDRIGTLKPGTEEIRKYLEMKNEDYMNNSLSEDDKSRLLRQWNESLENNVAAVEAGDDEGVEFYYYEIPGEDAVCRKSLSSGQYVSREQIFRYSEVIPPFHLGCGAHILPYRGDENLRDTAVLGMRPLFSESEKPSIPDWKNIIKPA